ncbi:MAG: phosphoribosylanthranilate isomerase [bacterium]
MKRGTKVKVCGITNREDAEVAVSGGADYLGFNFYPLSPRYVDPDTVRSIMFDLRGLVQTVGVFVNEHADTIEEICDRAGIEIIQLHGNEGAAFCRRLVRPVIKAFPLSERSDLSGMKEFHTWGHLVDSRTSGYGGSGVTVDWELAVEARDSCEKLWLAGGLDAENVREAIQTVKPWGVDAASRIESEPGKKDHQKMLDFLKAVKDAD